MAITESSVAFDDVFVGDTHRDSVTLIASAGAIKKGQVLALDSSGAGKYRKCDTSGTDNDKHIAVCVAAEDKANSTNTQDIRVVVSGKVLASKLVFHSTQDVDSRNGNSKSIRESLVDNNIIVITDEGGTLYNE